MMHSAQRDAPWKAGRPEILHMPTQIHEICLSSEKGQPHVQKLQEPSRRTKSQLSKVSGDPGEMINDTLR